ncbi:23S rRNA (adenine2030-N6)-methyltransferase [Litoreibacter ponti]|uniref:Ribosomal RNA large subunit methyltransferase J n=1 Tax=Litoreibacter ponti TaxID=1510457 RepID=A0A2T6BMX2_9RHOB|nr:23S rRNA (adenine(2030)-N(6))-methyltransferase RlmJ [Litoreibacter ponti]PTX57440.1 23S rRNA (adenine2030-N6)-methyltransferase [Litoreibacter ponti]
MLSYQHIFHAGNPADVHKHALLCAMLGYMCAKDKPISYLETHAGRGLYDLGAAEALKTGEAAAGITSLAARMAGDHPYLVALSGIRAAHGAQAYAGSPLLAAGMLRDGDRMHLAELHPQEFAALRDAMRPYRAKCYQQDGFEMAHAICPPEPRRGLMLIDPSYEVKSDYATIPGQIAKLHRKWKVGVIALWYPILTSGAHAPMLTALEALSLPKALRHEVRFPPVRAGHRMVGSGIFIANAPYGLEAEGAQLSELFRTAWA